MSRNLLQDFPVWGSGCGWGNGWKGDAGLGESGESTMQEDHFEAAHPSMFGYMTFRSGDGDGEGLPNYTGECYQDNHYG